MNVSPMELIAVNEALSQLNPVKDVDPAPEALVLQQGAISFLLRAQEQHITNTNNKVWVSDKYMWLESVISRCIDMKTTIDKTRTRWLPDASYIENHSKWYVMYNEEALKDLEKPMAIHELRAKVNKMLSKEELRNIY